MTKPRPKISQGITHRVYHQTSVQDQAPTGVPVVQPSSSDRQTVILNSQTMANWTPGVLWPSWPGSITTGDLDLSSTTTGVALEFIYGWLDPGCSLFALWDALVEGPPPWRPTPRSRVIARGITSEPLMITLLASRGYGSTPSLWRGKVLGDLIWLPIIQSGWVHALAIGGLSAGKSPAFRFIVLLWTKSRFEQHGSGVSKNVSKRFCGV